MIKWFREERIRSIVKYNGGGKNLKIEYEAISQGRGELIKVNVGVGENPRLIR